MLVTDTTAPVVQQGKGLLIITIIDVNEWPPVSFAQSYINLMALMKKDCKLFFGAKKTLKKIIEGCFL